ncbi:MaoC family dehydratase [Phenylobacterium sp.]|jgi:acyl dehydratase|uniref:MaoC family dehydratase n=1 Tax=Phenylobacterium sp. TaxID=1871053 RepID=UPI003783872D
MSETSPPLPPADQRYLEDYVPGAVYTFGEIEMTEAELLAFAEKYDPQPALHTDKALAEAGPFGGLIASGWHTIALTMRLYVDHFLSTVANSVSPGVDKIRWLKPVRPGDRLSIRVTVVANRRHAFAEHRGAITVKTETLNQDGDVVATFEAVSFVYSRDRDAAG